MWLFTLINDVVCIYVMADEADEAFVLVMNKCHQRKLSISAKPRSKNQKQRPWNAFRIEFPFEMVKMRARERKREEKHGRPLTNFRYYWMWAAADVWELPSVSAKWHCILSLSSAPQSPWPRRGRRAWRVHVHRLIEMRAMRNKTYIRSHYQSPEMDINITAIPHTLFIRTSMKRMPVWCRCKPNDTWNVTWWWYFYSVSVRLRARLSRSRTRPFPRPAGGMLIEDAKMESDIDRRHVWSPSLICSANKMPIIQCGIEVMVFAESNRCWLFLRSFSFSLSQCFRNICQCNRLTARIESTMQALAGEPASHSLHFEFWPTPTSARLKRIKYRAFWMPLINIWKCLICSLRTRTTIEVDVCFECK